MHGGSTARVSLRHFQIWEVPTKFNSGVDEPALLEILPVRVSAPRRPSSLPRLRSYLSRAAEAGNVLCPRPHEMSKLVAPQNRQCRYGESPPQTRARHQIAPAACAKSLWDWCMPDDAYREIVPENLTLLSKRQCPRRVSDRSTREQ